MLTHSLARLRRFARRCADTVRARVSAWTTPRPPSLATGLATDLVRRRRDLLLEHAILRQQVIVLGRTGKRPTFTPRDCGLLVLLAGRLRARAGALLSVQPETVLRWHRRGCRLAWRRKSAQRARPSPLAAATIEFVRQLARENPLRGAERIRGELRKLGIRVSKRTIQECLRRVPRSRPRGQRWATFLRNHVGAVGACDFLQVTDLPFRPLFAFFLVEPGSRRVVHVGVTRRPTDAWATRQLREATPYGGRPRFLVRDNDARYGPRFAQLAAASGIAVVRTPIRAPRANAIAERSCAVSGGRASTTCCCSARRTCGGRSASTSRISTGTGRTRGAASGGGCGTSRATSWPSRPSGAAIAPTGAPLETTVADGTHQPGAAAVTVWPRRAPSLADRLALGRDHARPTGPRRAYAESWAPRVAPRLGR